MAGLGYTPVWRLPAFFHCGRCVTSALLASRAFRGYARLVAVLGAQCKTPDELPLVIEIDGSRIVHMRSVPTLSQAPVSSATALEPSFIPLRNRRLTHTRTSNT
eukprot:GHVT01010597.1.p1 GENE.GHVT01010597.1~~GHVT01010597.1.p1  ORF type:complete len:104 (+),score=7.70 GHVT01010597.1:575-886(+)